MLPVSMARLATDSTLLVPLRCWVMPMAYMMAALSADAYIRAAAIRSSLGTPVIFSATSGGYFSTSALSSSRPSVRAAMKASSWRPSLMMTCIRPLSRATSVPQACLRCRSANRVSSIRRGSATISLVRPSRAARLILRLRTGWFSVVLDPITKITSPPPISAMEFDIAPLPNAVARPATVELCQRRAQ